MQARPLGRLDLCHRPVAGDDAGVEQVRHAEEAGDERRARALVQLRGRAELLDAPVLHHGDEVGHRHRLLLVVRDVHERDADLALDAAQLHLQLAAQLEVQRAERLVEQQRARVVDERARQRDALLLAAGELGGAPALKALELDELEDLGHAHARLGLRDLLALQPEADVLLDRQVREQRVALEDRVDVAPVAAGRP